MSYEHTFHYRDRQDLILQLDALLTKLLDGGGVEGLAVKMEPYLEARARYPDLSPSAFVTRLRRFEETGGHYPNSKGRLGAKIQEIFITKALHDWLSKPLKMRPKKTLSISRLPRNS